MSNRDRILWITRTAVFLAILVLFQYLTRPLSTYVTGSLVNLVLITSVMVCGLYSGVTVALLSPIFAFLVGIGPAFPMILPFVMLGNLTIVIVWHFIAGRTAFGVPRYSIALVAGAVLKFAVLYLGIVKLAIPFLLNLQPPQAAAISLSFSYPQLITAAVGGILAASITPLLKKVVMKGSRA